jgi:ABC-type transport system involved in multi-copper enzyme maturation permease subunit
MRTDIQVILWKEYRDFRHRLANSAGFLGTFLVLAGVIGPVAYLRDPLPIPIASALGWWVLATALMYAGLISAESFHEERTNGTLRTLLATSLRPLAIFLGKWLWMMALSATLLIASFLADGLILTGYGLAKGDWSPLTSIGLATWPLYLVLGLLACSYVISANAAISLASSNPTVARALEGIVLTVPLLGIWALNALLGIGWGRMMGMGVGVLCAALCLATAGAAYVTFRLEHTRL